MPSAKPNVCAQLEKLSFPIVGSESPVVIGQSKDRWTMLFVYRSKHCPRCKRFLNMLNALISNWHDVLDVVVVSADAEAKAKADKEKCAWKFDLGYGMTEARMRSLGLYVSSPLSDAETTGLFAEPALLRSVRIVH